MAASAFITSSRPGVQAVYPLSYLVSTVFISM